MLARSTDQEAAMPVLKLKDAEIHYEEYGKGYPVLLFAPGGMRSQAAMWHTPPGGPPRVWSDWTEVLAERYRVIAMDQRNAGRSRGAIAADHGWHTYAADQFALMDHLGLERFHTLGGCIGSSFCLKQIEVAPNRISAAVLQNPIGLNPEFPTYFPDGFADWTKEQRAERPELDPAAMRKFGENMWSGDFVFAVSRAFARTCSRPTLVLPGDDKPHPAVTGLELAEILPGTEMLKNWKGPEHIAEQRRRVLAFLDKHTPAQRH
jgi:pimeloyl-ACP methyl ester carboxylesterase